MASLTAADANPLHSYRAWRRLQAATRGGKMQGTLDVETTLSPETGFRYEVVTEEGASLIRKKVLLAALDAERAAIGGRDGALTSDNYEFVALSQADGLLRLDVRPRRKHVMLIEGSVLLSPGNYDLVAVEGALSKRPSFWTRHVNVDRRYARLNGVRVPVGMTSRSDVLIVGASTFSMTYCYREINGAATGTACAERDGRAAAGGN